MKQELVKPIVRVGNSAGVLLPKEWLNGRARIELVEKPIDIKSDVIERLGPYLDKTFGIYIVGSYARNEQTKESDVDILVITENIDKRIEEGKYNLILISKQELEKQLKSNALPLIPMLKEAKPLLNSKLIEKYKKTELMKDNLRFHIETTKSALKMNKEAIDIARMAGEVVSKNISYSLILRLRETYIVEQINKNKLPSNKELIRLIIKITGSKSLYENYLRIKENKKPLKDISIEESEKLHIYINKKIKEQEKWIKTRKSK
jgi:predicted nucleotidyltransferase